jgi:hypothetical protein
VDIFASGHRKTPLLYYTGEKGFPISFSKFSGKFADRDSSLRIAFRCPRAITNYHFPIHELPIVFNPT